MKLKSLSVALATTGLSLAALSLTTQATEGPERLFLQQVSTHSAVVKWRGVMATKSATAARSRISAKRNGRAASQGKRPKATTWKRT